MMRRFLASIAIASLLVIIIGPVVLTPILIVEAQQGGSGNPSPAPGGANPDSSGSGGGDNPCEPGGISGDSQKAIRDDNAFQQQIAEIDKGKKGFETQNTALDAQIQATQAGERASLEGQKKTNEANIKNLDKASEQVNKNRNEFRKTEAYRVAMIERRYNDLLQATKDSRGQLKGDDEIGKEQLKANGLYCAFLRKQLELEKCQAKEGEKASEKCKKQAEEAKKAGAEVRKSVMKIAELERKKAEKATFEVSRIFSARERTEARDAEKLSFARIVNTFADWMITIVASLAVTTLIIGGFMMIISGGDESRLETGKTIFTYSLIGLVITLTAFGIITFVQSLFY